MNNGVVLVAQMSHETNTFNPVITTFENFQRCGFYVAEQVVERFRRSDTELGGFIDTLEAAGEHVAGGVAASAIPSGPVASDVLVALERHLLAVLQPAPLRGILLALHGAMVSEEGESCELRLLRWFRTWVGPAVPIICTLDLHANVPDELVHLTTALLPYDTNPHRDLRERGEEAAALLLRLLKGRVQVTSVIRRLPLLLSPLNQGTSQGPMAEVREVARRWEAQPGVINVGVLPGFPFADVPDAGFSAITITDGDPDLADRATRNVLETAWALREEFLPRLLSARDAIAEVGESRPGLVVLAEVADNVNAGSTGDGTHLLRSLLETETGTTAFAAVADAEAVAAAMAAGVGNRLTINVGGKISELSGPPLLLDAYVRLASDGRFINVGANNGAGMLKGFPVDMGRTVVLQAPHRKQDFAIIVTERAVPPIGPEMFRSLGIELASVRLLAVKTRGHYWEPYKFVGRVVEVETPGLASPNLSLLPYRRLRRPKFPLDRIL